MQGLIGGSFVSVVEVIGLPPEVVDQWLPGPLPLLLQGDEEALSPEENQGDNSGRLYLSRRVHHALYDQVARHHLQQDYRLLELLAVTDTDPTQLPAAHLLVIHCSVGRGSGITDIKMAVRSVTDEVVATLGARAGRRRFHLICAMTQEERPYVVDDAPALGAPFEQSRALLAWQLATLRPDHPPAGELVRLEATMNLFEPMAALTVLVHHDGAALVFQNSDREPSEPFGQWGAGEPADYSINAEVQWHVWV